MTKLPIKQSSSPLMTVVSFLSFVVLNCLWVSPSLSSDGAESPEVVTRTMIRDLKNERIEIKTKEAARLKNLGAVSPDLAPITHFKRAKFYTKTNPKLALQLLHIAESVTPKDDRKLFTEIRLQKATIYKNALEYKMLLSVLKHKRLRFSGEQGVQIRKFRAQSYSKLNDHRRAVFQFRKIIDDISHRGLSDEFAMDMAKSFGALKKYKYRQKMLETVAARYPFSPLSSDAMSQLILETKRHKSSYFFSSSLLRRMKLHATLSEKLEDRMPEFLDLPFTLRRKDISRPTLLERAELAMNLDLNDAASEALELAKTTLKTRKEKSKYLLLSSRYCIRDGDFECALEHLYDHQKTYPYLSQRERINARIAKILSDKGEFAESSVIFGKFAKKTNRRQDRWNHFWTLYRAKKYDAALSALKKRGYIKGHDTYRTTEERKYWTGKVFEKLGRVNEAAEVYGDLIHEYPDSFYTVLLRSRFGNLQQSMADPMEVTRNSKLLKIMKRMVKSARVIIASTGLVNLGTGEKITKKKISEINQELQSRIVANLKIKTRKESDQKKNVFKKFPKAFEGIVRPHAEGIDVDPYLTYSLMKAESGFDKDAVSWVGATGLMQIMPYTGIRIAGELSDSLFEFNSLKDPLVNVSYAQYYIKRLVDHFDGNIVHAIAAYNGGPKAVDRWVERCKGCEIDDFVESIGYRETRKYVKKVLRFYSYYKFLYEDARPLESWPEVPYKNDSKRPIF